MYHIKHESPQILVVDNEKVIYNESHLDINYEDLKSNL
jgi:bacillithiol system protein YtxJ